MLTASSGTDLARRYRMDLGGHAFHTRTSGAPQSSAVRARSSGSTAVSKLRAARVACLEESSAACLLPAIGGRGNAWCHGIAADPVRLHAWICDEHGHPVDEPGHTDQYTRLNAPNPTGVQS